MEEGAKRKKKKEERARIVTANKRRARDLDLVKIDDGICFALIFSILAEPCQWRKV